MNLAGYFYIVTCLFAASAYVVHVKRPKWLMPLVLMISAAAVLTASVLLLVGCPRFELWLFGYILTPRDYSQPYFSAAWGLILGFLGVCYHSESFNRIREALATFFKWAKGKLSNTQPPQSPASSSAEAAEDEPPGQAGGK